MSSPLNSISLHEYMKTILKESKNYSFEKKTECAKKLCEVQQLQVNLRNKKADDDTIKRLFEVFPKTVDLVAPKDRSKYLICTTGGELNEKYIFCSICAVFSDSSDNVRVGYPMNNLNFSSANTIIKRHENTKAHLKSIQCVYGVCDEDEYIDLIVPINTDSIEFAENTPIIESSTNKSSMTRKQSTAMYSNTKLKKIIIERNRRIAADVIQCVLFLISFGKKNPHTKFETVSNCM